MSFEGRVREVIDRRLENVKPAGEDNYRAKCPIHEGPSSGRTFSINGRTGVWICFHSSCALSGSFPKLMRLLGMTPSQIDEVMKESRPTSDVPEYLKIKAQISHKPVFLPEYILGAWSDPPKSLLDAGFSEKILREHEVGVDKQRNRIVFPVRDFSGRLAAINGRAMEPWMLPRYKVYDSRRGGELEGLVEKYVPDNRRQLYGYHTVYPERFFRSERDCPPLCIVEGYKACLWMRQLGFSHTVALQGSSLSSGQKLALERLSGPFFVLLDNQPGKSYADKFGRCAAIDIAEALSRSGKAFVCQYPKEKPINAQPDNLNKEEVDQILRQAKTPAQIAINLV